MALEIGVDSFATVAEADTYWQNHARGDNWAEADEPEKEKALREASQYIDKMYYWRGDHPGSQQLSWPRYNVVDKQGRLRSSGEVPQEVKDGTAWLAERTLTGPVLTDSDRTIKNLKAGPVSITYGDNAPTQPTYDYLDLLVSDLIRGGKNQTVLLKG